MIQDLLDDMKAYFDAKENPTEQERQLQRRLSGGYFPITAVHRDDLQDAGFDTDKISNADMKKLARKMADDYCEQLFWSSMEIIADEILGFPKVTTKDVICPKCGSEKIRYDIHENLFHCDTCSQTWDDKRYVLVEFPEESAPFEEEGTGYPAWGREDNGARYIPEAEYIRHFNRSPDPEKHYRAVRWPDSQQYMGNEECEPIQDEAALKEFGPSACWVPISLPKKM